MKGPGSPFGGEDTKSSWIAGNHDNDPARLLTCCREVVWDFVTHLSQAGNPPRFNEEILVNGPVERALDLMSRRPWWHPNPRDQPLSGRN